MSFAGRSLLFGHGSCSRIHPEADARCRAPPARISPLYPSCRFGFQKDRRSNEKPPLPIGRGRFVVRPLVGSRRGGGRLVAALAHELVELRAILGRTQAIEIVVELALLLVELAQGRVAILVEGDVARALVAPALTPAPARLALHRAPLFARATACIATFG